MKSKRDYGIDLIRGLSMLYIVGYWHLFNYTHAFRGYYNPVTHHLTRIILASFVFVSGYLIAAKKINLNFPNILVFWRQRLLRIYPLYLIALLLFYWQDIAQRWTLIKAGLLASMFFPPAPPTLWFITMIMWFYLLAPFLLNTNRNWGVFLIINTFLIGLFYQLGSTREMLTYFPSFGLGIFLRSRPILLKQLQQKQLILTITFLVFYWLNIINPNRELVDLVFNVIFINLGAVLFYSYSNQIMAKFKYPKIILFLSYASFCMYLFHRPIFTITKKIFFPVGELEQVLYLLAVSLPLTIVISWLSQKLYDRLLLR